MATVALDHQRLFDLVRYARGFLHDEGLITLAEYTALLTGGGGAQAARRLEGYDELRAQLSAVEARANEYAIEIEHLQVEHARLRDELAKSREDAKRSRAAVSAIDDEIARLTSDPGGDRPASPPAALIALAIKVADISESLT